VFWELTARCNLRCQHCRAVAQAEAVEGELSTAEIVRVAHEIRESADPIMILTGGEPLARADFFDIAAACTGLFSRVALATNGTLVDDGLARRIVSGGIQRVSISLDGASPQTHDAFRGLPGAFADALRGLAALQRAGASVQINVTVTRHNEDELPTLLEFALEQGIAAFHVFMLVPVGCGAEIADDKRLTPEAFERCLHWLAAKTLELRERIQIKATCAPQYYRILHEEARRQGVELPGRPGGHGGMHAVTRGCLAGSGVCFVSRTGDVQPCGYLPVCVGNLRTRKLGDIWSDSEVFAALRNPRSLKGKCGACGYRVLCQGCRARALALTGDYLGEEPDCPYVPDGYVGTPP
jgi:heme b synthase